MEKYESIEYFETFMTSACFHSSLAFIFELSYVINSTVQNQISSHILAFIHDLVTSIYVCIVNKSDCFSTPGFAYIFL